MFIPKVTLSKPKINLSVSYKYTYTDSDGVEKPGTTLGWYSFELSDEEKEILIKMLPEGDFINKQVIPDALNEIRKIKPTEEKDIDIGFIYLIQVKHHGIFKIGKTIRDDGARMAALSKLSPKELVLLDTFKTIYHTDVEKEIHDYLKNNRYRGEWFRMKKNDILKVFRKYKKQYQR